MKKLLPILMILMIFGCSRKPKISQYEKVHKTEDSICVVYNATLLSELTSHLIIPNLNTWKVQELTKSKRYVFETDLLSSIIKKGDSLLLIQSEPCSTLKLYLPKRYRNISESNYVVFTVDNCEAIINKGDIDFLINGSIVNVMANNGVGIQSTILQTTTPKLKNDPLGLGL